MRGQLLLPPSPRPSITLARRPHPAAPERLRPGGGRCRADAASGEPAVRADRRRPQLRAAELQRLRPAHRHRHAVAVRSGSGRRSLTSTWKVGRGPLTSTTAWRYWNWDPSNDRDFIGLPVTAISAAPSKQRQWTQEVRYAGSARAEGERRRRRFAFHQKLDSNPVLQAGARLGRGALPAGAASDARRRRRGCSTATASTRSSNFRNLSAAAFGQIDWAITDRLQPAARPARNYDQKSVNFDQQVYGGLQTDDPRLIALQRSVLAPQAYDADVDDTNWSGPADGRLRPDATRSTPTRPTRPASSRSA